MPLPKSCTPPRQFRATGVLSIRLDAWRVVRRVHSSGHGRGFLSPFDGQRPGQSGIAAATGEWYKRKLVSC